MKTDSDLLNILHYDISDCPISQSTQNLPTLSTREIERIVELAKTTTAFFTLDQKVTDYICWCYQILSDRKVEESEISEITSEQLQFFGIPSGQCDIWGNDLY